MDIEDVGKGGAGGILGALMAWLGFKSQINNIEKKVNRLCNEVRYKDTCDATHKPIERQLEKIDSKLDKLLEK